MKFVINFFSVATLLAVYLSLENAISFVGVSLFVVEAQVTEQAALPEVKFQDSVCTVLTVGNDIYTNLDAILLLAIWDNISGESTRLSLDWRKKLQFNTNHQKDLVLRVSEWPQDAKRFLFVALAWNETKKFNLFVPTAKDLESARVKTDRKIKWDSVAPDIQSYFNEIPAAKLNMYLEIILRSISFLKIRGDFSKNSSLLATRQWHWHSGCAND